MSIQGIQQNPQDTSNFYLANIYATLADPSQPNSSSLPASPPPFSPPTHAVWVNALWFLSLVISLTCALLATLLQQWARRYLKVTQSRYSLHKRARIRAFLSEGVEKLLLPWTVETLPALLHISLFLFFAGLVVFLWNVNLTIFKLVLSWVGVCTALYGCITFIPVFRRDSPYHTPLSLPAWHVVTGILFLTFRALRRLAWTWDYLSWESYVHFRDLAESCGKRLVQGMQKTMEEAALNSPSEINTRALIWTLDSLDEDHELEHFFSALPGFCNSRVVKDPLLNLTRQQKWKLLQAMTGLLNRTFSSDLLSAPVKERRAMLCAKAADPALLDSHATIPMIVARTQPRDDSWFILASKSLGIPEAVLRDYATHGDNLSLAILIYVTCQQFSNFWQPYWPGDEFSTVLEAASKFNIHDTSPQLQHEFCALWNQVVSKAQNDHDAVIAFDILGQIRRVYITLHQDTDSSPTQFSTFTRDWDPILKDPDSYPVCNVPGHHPYSTPHTGVHDNSASIAFDTTVLHDHHNATLRLVPFFLGSSSHMPPSSAHAPLRVDETFTDVPPLNNIISVPDSQKPIDDQTTTESCHVPATPPNPVAPHVTNGNLDTSARTTHLSTPEPSASAPPPESKASISPLDAATVEHTPASRTPSPDVPSSPSPTHVVDDMLPTGPPSSPDSPVAGSDHTSSAPEAHSSMLASGAHGPSLPQMSSAPDLGAGAEGEGSAKVILRKEEDASLAIREDTMATPDLPHVAATATNQ